LLLTGCSTFASAAGARLPFFAASDNEFELSNEPADDDVRFPDNAADDTRAFDDREFTAGLGTAAASFDSLTLFLPRTTSLSPI
jgi:hypothetical protein